MILGPRSPKEHRISLTKQSCHSLSASRQRTDSLSVRLSVWLSVCLFICLPSLCPFHVSFNPFFFYLSFLCCLLTFLPPFIFTSFFPSHLFVLSFLFTVLPLFCLSFLFFLTSFLLASLLFPPVLPFVCPSSPPSFLSPCNCSSHLQSSQILAFSPFFHFFCLSFLFCLSILVFTSVIPSFFHPSCLPSINPLLICPSCLLSFPPSFHSSVHLSSLSHIFFMSSILFLLFLHFSQSSFLSLVFLSFLLSFFLHIFLLLVPPPVLCIMVWTQLCALHTLSSTWLQPHVLLLFGQHRDNQICVKCSLTLGSTLTGVSTQAGFELPAQMWLCLLCRPFKSDWDLMNRWEQAHQIWAGSANPARVDWHTNQQRNRVRMCIFHWKAFRPFKYVRQVFILFLCLATFFIYCSLNRKKKMFPSVSKKRQAHMSHVCI